MLHSAYVVTSWDDADVKSHKLASILEKYNLQATFFVPVTPVGIERISDDDVRVLAQRFEIGSHSVSHSSLTKLPHEKLIKEVHDSKRALEEMLGQRITSFCYPDGFYNDAVVHEVRRAGYIAARTTAVYSNSHFLSPLKIGTTIQARKQTRLTCNLTSLLRLIRLGGPSSIAKMWFEDWSKLAIFLFDITMEKGGIFHIWGHAWEIEKQHGWVNLESVFSHISNRKKVNYCTFSEYVQNIRWPRT